MRYISDIIGADYLHWECGSQIIISSQTGSGKSTFVFEKLLKHAAAKSKYLVYFCNKRTFENQMKHTIGKGRYNLSGPIIGLSEKEESCLILLTYQYCEATKQFPDFSLYQNSKNDLSKEEEFKLTEKCIYNNSEQINEKDVMYYVFDEAHYFISDSLFNANTNFWTPDKLKRENSISVFLTSTPEPLICYLNEDRHRKAMGTLNYFSNNTPLSMEVVLTTINNNLIGFHEEKRHNEEAPVNIGECAAVQNTLVSIPYYHSCDSVNSDGNRYNYLSANKTSENSVNKQNPYDCGIEFIIDSLTNELPGVIRYQNENDYSYIEPVYIEGYDDIIDGIIESDKKWLIFVDKEREGKELETILNQNGCSAVFISAKRRKNTKSGAKATFLQIAENERFESKVLIATSVLDCGVSIKDPELTNIVIAQPDKTEFIQMIGRRRVSDGERIKLYIKKYTPKEINSLRMGMEKRLRFIIKFFLLNQYDGIYKLDIEAKKEVIRSALNKDNARMLFTNESFPLIVNIEYLSEYLISKTAYIQVLYSLFHYISVLDYYRKTKDAEAYLKFQLSWIGKEYDEKLWYKYEEKKNALIGFLEYMCTKDWLDTEEQNTFCKECIELIMKLPTVLLTDSMKKYITQYKNSVKNREILPQKIDAPSNYDKIHKKNNGVSLPGKNRLNTFFEEKNLPYRIDSKQFYRNNRMWFWKITKTD